MELEPIRFLGLPEENFSGTRLPTGIEVLKAYFFQTRVLKTSKSDAAIIVADKIIEVWSHTSRTVNHRSDVTKKIKTLTAKYEKVMKNYGRNRECQMIKESRFLEEIYALFDIENKRRSRQSAENLNGVDSYGELDEISDGDEDYVPTDGEKCFSFRFSFSVILSSACEEILKLHSVKV